MMTSQRMALLSAFVMAGELLATDAVAHGGGLDANGCHHDRKHGGYHCHRGASSSPATPSNFAPMPADSLRPTRNPGDSVYYANCSAARAAGAAPVRRGDPGYAPYLDRDGDGVGCE